MPETVVNNNLLDDYSALLLYGTRKELDRECHFAHDEGGRLNFTNAPIERIEEGIGHLRADEIRRALSSGTESPRARRSPHRGHAAIEITSRVRRRPRQGGSLNFYERTV